MAKLEPPSFAGGQIVVGTTAGQIIGYEADGGKETWYASRRCGLEGTSSASASS